MDHVLLFFVFFSSFGVCLNVESIVCELCVKDTLVQECKTERGWARGVVLINKSNQSMA